MLTLEQATAGAAKISDALFTSLEKMPKFLRLKTWTDDEREGYIARIWLDANEKSVRKEAAKEDSKKMKSRHTAFRAFVTGIDAVHRHSAHDVGCSCGNFSGPGSLCLGREF